MWSGSSRLLTLSVTESRAEPGDGDLPWGVRAIASLGPGDVHEVGEEVGDLAVLLGEGVPVAPGWIVSLAGEDAEARLLDVVARGLAGGSAGSVARIRPLFPTRAVAARFEQREGMAPVVGEPTQARSLVGRLMTALAAPELTAAFGGSLGRLWVRVVVTDGEPAGRAASADPGTGDPDRVLVWTSAAAPWQIDRRTARVTLEGEGAVSAQDVSRAADVADRVQLALGRPVEIEWAAAGKRMSVIAVRPVHMVPAFTAVPFRIVSLIAEDEGTVAPLAVDSLDKALRHDEEATDDATVRRIYARPYQRRHIAATLPSGSPDPASLARAAARAGRVAADVVAPLAAASRFERGLPRRLAAMDSVDLSQLDAEQLLECLRERQKVVVEAMTLLDRARAATRACFTALQAAVGALPRDCFPALARPRPCRARRRVHDRLARMARRVRAEQSTLVGPEGLSTSLRREWRELRGQLEDTRSLGLDVCPRPMGADDASLLAALEAELLERYESDERARRDAVRRLLVTARGKSFGRTREGLVASVAVVLGRVASSKGQVAEGLAAASLRLRAVACEAGRRLCEAGVVEQPEDALYMFLAEIGQGLSGEPGAYGARVRLRREDDGRWASFRAPRRIDVRGPQTP